MLCKMHGDVPLPAQTIPQLDSNISTHHALSVKMLMLAYNSKCLFEFRDINEIF